MSRNKRKSYSEKEKFKKKCRAHRIKYEKERKEGDDVEKKIKKKTWSKWLNFIGGYWCGRMKKATNPLNTYIEALGADVFEIPVEPKSTAIRTKMTIFGRCKGDLAQLENKSNFVSKRKENPSKEEEEEEESRRLQQNSDSFYEATGKNNSLISDLDCRQNMNQLIQNASLAVPRLWNSSGETIINESSRTQIYDIFQKTSLCSENQIIVGKTINRTLSEPTWNEKAKTYYQRQVKAGINSLLDQLMRVQQDFYTAEFKEPKEKKKVKFNVENSKWGKKGSLPQKISRQVSPEVLVNIKPFKTIVTQNNPRGNFPLKPTASRFNLNKVDKTTRLEIVKYQPEEIEVKSENFEFCRPALKDQILTPTQSNVDKKKDPILPKDLPTENDVKKNFCFVFGMYQNCNETRAERSSISLNEVLENFDDSDHDIVFKKNLKQFRKEMSPGFIKKNDERGPEKGVEAHPKIEKLEKKTILSVDIKPEIILGIHYDFITDFNIVKRAYLVKKDMFNLTVSQTVREIYQFSESYFSSVVQKKLSNKALLFIREVRGIHADELRSACTLRELKYCMMNVEEVARVESFPAKNASNISFVTRGYSTFTQPELSKSRSNAIDMSGFLQEYSELVEKSCSGDNFINVEQILSTLANSFNSLDLTETKIKSNAPVVNINAAVEILAEYHRVVQILNDPAPEYLVFIYQSLGPRSCSEKGFSETDLHKRRRHAIAVFSETTLLEDFSKMEFRHRGFRPTLSFDGFRILYNGIISPYDEDDETLKHFDSKIEKVFDCKKKECNFVTSMGEKKMLTFKSNSSPGDIATTSAQKSNLFRDLHKDYKKKRKPADKGLDLNKRVNSVHLESEKLIKTDSDSAKFHKYLFPEDLVKLKGNGSKKMFFFDKNTGKLEKEVIAAFSTIKALCEEKDRSRTSVIIILSKK